MVECSGSSKAIRENSIIDKAAAACNFLVAAAHGRATLHAAAPGALPPPGPAAKANPCVVYDGILEQSAAGLPYLSPWTQVPA
jgi:hypothetical protein